MPLASFYAAARRASDGSYSAAIFTADGQDVRAVALPERGHDITVCPVTRRCVVFARRPGNFAIAFSANRDEPPLAFTTLPIATSMVTAFSRAMAGCCTQPRTTSRARAA